MMFVEHIAYSPIEDKNISRISVANDRGHEYFMLIPCEGGKAYREARLTALECLVEAIQMGLPPGQVRIN